MATSYYGPNGNKINITKVCNGYIVEVDGYTYVFSTFNKMTNFLEKELEEGSK